MERFGTFCFFISLLLILFFQFRGPPRHDLAYLDVKPYKLCGEIINRAHDHKNWGRPTLTIDLGKDSLFGKDTVALVTFFCTYPLWQIAEIGDSLSKVPGSLEYQLFKEDTVLYFYPHCVEDKDIGIVKNPNWRKKRKIALITILNETTKTL
ncbi:MAG: hypothetical protein AAGC85_13615 [Bacteroidota bacterium]